MYKDQLTHARNVKTCPPNVHISLVTDSRKTELNGKPDKEFKGLGL